MSDSHTPNDHHGASGAQPPAQRPAGQDGPPHDKQPKTFDALYRAQNKEVFRALVARELLAGHDPSARAGEYVERGKPEFVLAFLLAADLPDADKRELLARAYEQRAQLTEQKADEFDRRFHRPFPLLRLEASKDRTLAQRIRAGGTLRPGLGRPLPTL
ncbi:MAG TPA: hypothetical protein VGN32_19050 [Ktedonobacterales bacterium]|nr:hypothetical protein [Ktedonobacterales bacterium]